ncbi:hypothetical protein LXL04_023263 [Taraxacum kok-saghyz]
MVLFRETERPKLDHNAHDHEVLWLSRFGGCFWHFWTNLPFSGWLPLALSMMQVVPFSQRLQQLKLHQLPVLPVSNNISWLPFVLAFGLHLEQPKRPIVDLNLTAYSVFSMVAAVLVIKPKSGNKEMDDQGCKCDTGEERMMSTIAWFASGITENSLAESEIMPSTIDDLLTRNIVRVHAISCVCPEIDREVPKMEERGVVMLSKRKRNRSVKETYLKRKREIGVEGAPFEACVQAWRRNGEIEAVVNVGGSISSSVERKS